MPKQIRTFLLRIAFWQRILALQLLRKWVRRVRLLLTIYRHDKINAIKNYVRNDRESMTIRREIDTFKVANGYDFRGALLPVCVITPDSYLNVLKPNIEKLKYDTDEIEKFYAEQKKQYKTLIYWKDFVASREPTYMGGHMISHGFPYFFKEITIGSNDVVVDLGAAPGDFSAVCIQNGASRVYAFEPEENGDSSLAKVSALNQNKIEIVRRYCDVKTNPDANSISLDDFVCMNCLDRIDFIKADIEGAEVAVLQGAKRVLKDHQPKLAFCAYHYINDTENIATVILGANPKYKVYKREGVVYAF